MPTVMGLNLDLYGSWRKCSEVLLKQFRNLRKILVRYQAHGYLRVSFRGKDGLSPFAGIASPDAVDIQGRPDTCTLNGGITSLSSGFGYIQFFSVNFFVKGCFVQFFTVSC